VDIDVPSAVEVFTTLRYINVHLLTYLLTYYAWLVKTGGGVSSAVMVLLIYDRSQVINV